MSPDSPAIRRATEADAPVLEALWPRREAGTGERATFVIEEAGGVVVGAVALSQPADHLVIDCIAVATDFRKRGYGKLLVAFAEAAAREVEVKEVHLGPAATGDDFFRALGYAEGRKRIEGGALHIAHQHLEAVGVPLLRDGTAPLGRTIYYRAVWALVAIIVAIGSISLAVFSRGQITILHVLAPALLCLCGTLFATSQLFLVVVAARRTGFSLFSGFAIAGSIAAFIAIVVTLENKILPQLAELWTIYNGDAEMSDFTLTASADGRTLTLDGTIGAGTAVALRRALDDHPAVREIVLSGPGGRIGPAFEIEGLIRKRRLDTRVEGDCASACALVFLGGVERRLLPQARLAFHQAGFPGMNQAEMLESNRTMVRFLVVQAGLTPAFANRVVDTPANELWMPTREELMAGRVIHRLHEKN